MSKQYVKMDGVWVEVYRKETWRDWAYYGVALVLACATFGILVL